MDDCLSPTPCSVGWLMADTKVVQKSAQNLKIMLLAIQLLWAANNVGRANHTCIICFIYVFTIPYELNNLILML